MKIRSIISILLPIVSIMLIAIIIKNPSIIGFATIKQELYLVNATINLQLENNYTIPENSYVKISLGNQTKTMPIQEFKKKAEYKNNSYILNIKDAGINNLLKKGEYPIKVSIIHNSSILFGSTDKVII